MTNTPEPGAAYWRLVGPVWRSVSIYRGPEMFLRQFRKLPLEVGYLLAAHWCQSEVCNGGFHQFFANDTGVLAPEALDGFRAIGLQEWAEILAEAMQQLGTPYPRDRAERWERLPRADGRRREEWDTFYRLDKRFYQWLHAEQDRWLRAADLYASRYSAKPGATDVPFGKA